MTPVSSGCALKVRVWWLEKDAWMHHGGWGWTVGKREVIKEVIGMNSLKYKIPRLHIHAWRSITWSVNTLDNNSNSIRCILLSLHYLHFPLVFILQVLVVLQPLRNISYGPTSHPDRHIDAKRNQDVPAQHPLNPYPTNPPQPGLNRMSERQITWIVEHPYQRRKSWHLQDHHSWQESWKIPWWLYISADIQLIVHYMLRKITHDG